MVPVSRDSCIRNISSPVKNANYHNSVRLGAIIDRVSLMEGYT